ncbi:MAG: CRISPR-associated endonuclease Cas2 [Clostridiales Family XIII bacterium]|jgi:CRISPR-associated protein Cas2|nr:CRISPR-associated endonuclease Cas2 [Clostridiales Family XIII bacterium]
MFVVITYDVNTQTPEGQRRLHKISKACQNYGQRVQNSVFECLIDYGTFLKLKHELETIANEKTDSLRYYKIGNKWEPKVEQYGVKSGCNPEGTIII